MMMSEKEVRIKLFQIADEVRTFLRRYPDTNKDKFAATIGCNRRRLRDYEILANTHPKLRELYIAGDVTQMMCLKAAESPQHRQLATAEWMYGIKIDDPERRTYQLSLPTDPTLNEEMVFADLGAKVEVRLNGTTVWTFATERDLVTAFHHAARMGRLDMQFYGRTGGTATAG